MKKAVVLFTLCLLAAFVVSSVYAAKPAVKAHSRSVAGTVMVVKDANGVVTEITIRTAYAKCYIVLDTKGMELAALEGKKAKVTGIVEGKGKVEWLKVQKFEESPAAPKKPKEKGPKEKCPKK